MKIHVPTEQYGFIEADIDTVEDAKSLSDAVKTVFGMNVPQTELESLRDKEFNKIIDAQLMGELKVDQYEALQKMNPTQKAVADVIKRSLARIKNKDK